MLRRFFLVAICLLPLVETLYAQSNFTSSETTRASIGTYQGTAEANGANSNAQISRNGRFVVFESTATNLVNYVTVTAGRKHVYLLDRQSGSLELISINRSSAEVAGDSYSPSVSADGRYVAFVSNAPSNQFFSVSLCSPGAHVNIFNAGTHIYVRDRLANRTFLASQTSAPVEVQDGVCDGTGAKVQKKCIIKDCDLNDPTKYTLEPIMVATDMRVAAAILPYRNSDFTFTSATSLHPRISGDGQFVTFDTDADNLAGVAPVITYLKPVADQSSSCTSGTCDYTNSSLSASGGIIRGVIGFPAIGAAIDGNSVRDVIVRDGLAFTSKMVSLGCLYHATGNCNVQGQLDSVLPQISDDGKFISFESRWNFLDLDFNTKSDIFLVARSDINAEVSNLDRISNNTSRLLAADDASNNSAMSADGRYIAFDSAASNIITGDTNGKRDVFVYDSKFFVTVRCGVSSAPEGNGDATTPSIDGSGNFITFESTSTNWGSPTGTKQIYVGQLVRDSIGRLSECKVALASLGSLNTGGNGASSIASLGTVPRTSATPGAPRTQIATVAYQSLATNLHSGAADTNGVSDIFQAPNCSAVDLVTDTDGDGTIDCFDQCKDDALRVVDKDTDADGYPDCEDGCDSDAQKFGPGLCGCGVLDTDSDADGTPDCTDTCPVDPAKTSAGTCGCGVPDLDLNNNGVIDCVESAAPTNPTPSGTTPPSASPTPGSSVDLPSLSPGTSKLVKTSSRSVSIQLTVSLNLGSNLAGYEVALERVTGNTVGERVVQTVKTTIAARNLGSGRYRARFRIVNTSGQRSKWSKFSNSFRVR